MSSCHGPPKLVSAGPWFEMSRFEGNSPALSCKPCMIRRQAHSLDDCILIAQVCDGMGQCRAIPIKRTVRIELFRTNPSHGHVEAIRGQEPDITFIQSAFFVKIGGC